MDHQSISDVPPADTGTLGPPPQQLRDRRREKPLLSCTFCRSRKVRCDRRLPCRTCTSRGIGLSCTYVPGAQYKTKGSVGDRIQQLETLVRTLVQQQQQQTPQTPAVHPDVAVTETPAYPSLRTPSASIQSVSGSAQGMTPLASTDDDGVVPPLRPAFTSHDRDRATSPAPFSASSPATSSAPSEHGSMRMHSHPANYVGSVHWAAVLDSISELRDHYEEEEEARILATSDCVPRNSPRLLYEPVQATKADILALIPARPVVDRIVARYFNAQSTTPLSMLHSVHFLREYERFWQEPSSASVLWIGLLFSIMALTLQFSQLGEDETDPEDVVRIYVFREQTIHCLGLGHYTKGGEYVLETMINYIALEMSLCKDADIGLWLVLGMLIQLALSMGYHRDAQNFSNISPFAGEMRRRVWAVIVQMDLRLSSQMGFPRLLKLHQCDTAEPRNLLDTDFDETCTELPPSRPETEVTPVLYILAKNRVDGMTGWVSDLLAEVREHPYAEIMELDRKLEDAENSLPPVFRWQPLSQSLMVPPQIIIYRIWLHLSIPRLKIWLHRKYLAPSYAQSEYAYSRNACVQAAMKILEFQQLVDEETQPDGLLYSARWMMITSLQQFVFLLGTSILCYYVQLAKTRPDVSMDQKTSARIYELLRNTYPIWLRSSTVSQEARRAAVHLSLLLGLRGQETEGPLAEEAAAVATAATSDYTTPQNAGMSFDQVTWDAYQECIANFPPTAAFGADFFAPPVPGSSSEAGVSMADPMVGNTVELGGWMEGHGA